MKKWHKNVLSAFFATIKDCKTYMKLLYEKAIADLKSQIAEIKAVRAQEKADRAKQKTIKADENLRKFKDRGRYTKSKKHRD